MGIRSPIKDDIQATFSELVYGSTLRLASDVFCSDRLSPPSPTSTYITQLREIMLSLHPTATSKHRTKSIYTHPPLYSGSHVYSRIDCVQPPLSQPYSGLHHLIARKGKTFIITVKGKN
ncbi:ATP-dependent DNA helicase [Caerostris darwini]|uniref:ATP-dependent DNA helicase n=1 Tax=Caerostris darwini TaxID=1538125 RepID=A0AAV4VH66_9ARAC|nr:ATP-dependent DNA helicase [Caerostris darwini]